MTALIRFYYPGIDIESLSDEDFARTWGELKYCLAFARDLRHNDLK